MAEAHCQFTTESGHGQSIKFSPFNGNRVAVVVGADYGLTGEGYAYVLERNEATGQLEQLWKTDYRDNLLDVSWSETEPNVLCTAAGDGFIQVYNIGGKFPKVPVHEFKAPGRYKKEFSSVDWNVPKYSNSIVASSWDGHVFIYDLTSQWPLTKIAASELLVYQAVWSPHSKDTFICVSSDGIVQLWDLVASKEKSQLYMSACNTELLTCDWAKYSDNIIATGGSDSIIRGWDIRNPKLPIFQLEDNAAAVKRLKFSPFLPTILASVGYDLTLRTFECQTSQNIEVINQHSEYIYGLDWNLHEPFRNEIATCAWDKSVKLVTPQCLQGK